MGEIADDAIDLGREFPRHAYAPGVRSAGEPATELPAARLATEAHLRRGSQQPAQSRKISGQRISRSMRRLVRPYAVDEQIGGHGPVHVDQQGNQHAALARVADVDSPTIDQDLDVAEEPEVHRPRRHACNLADHRRRPTGLD